jgi:Ca2+/Na+ antiporter
MKQKLRLIFGDFLNALHSFWLEVIGGVFLAIGVMLGWAAVRQYFSVSERRVTTMLATEGIFAALMIFFALDSFWRARKPR